jgi:hypothetical protein
VAKTYAVAVRVANNSGNGVALRPSGSLSGGGWQLGAIHEHTCLHVSEPRTKQVELVVVRMYIALQSVS